MPIASCKICNDSFYVKPSHQERGWGKYCSIGCRKEAQYRGKNFLCKICNKVIYKTPKDIRKSKSGHFFCSKSCQTKWRNTYYVEDKHPNWAHGESAYRQILKRSGVPQICSCCGLTDHRVLTVHHIDHNRKNNNLHNLAWVCFNCHYLIHHDKSFEESFINTIKAQTMVSVAQ